MSVSFSGVTDITIPQGSVERITETNSGRVLWDKYMHYMDTGDYYRGILKYKNSDGNISCGHDIYIWNDSVETVQNNVHLGGVIMDDTPNGKNTVNIGDQYTACYIRYPQQNLNFGIITRISSYAKELSDTIWTFSAYTTLQAVNRAKNERTDIVTIGKIPMKFSKLKGNTVKISSIESDFSEYRLAFNNSSVAMKAPTSSFPYLHGWCHVTLSSDFLNEKLIEQGEQIANGLEFPYVYNKGLPCMYFYFNTYR